MKAFRFDRHGGPEVLRFEDVPLPEPGPGEVRIRHTAVALNFRDILVRRGQHAVKSFPSGLGTESAGVIEARRRRRHRVSPSATASPPSAGPTAPMPKRASRRPRASSSCRTASTSAPPPR